MKKIKLKIKKIDFKVAFILKLETFCKWGKYRSSYARQIWLRPEKLKQPISGPRVVHQP